MPKCIICEKEAFGYIQVRIGNRRQKIDFCEQHYKELEMRNGGMDFKGEDAQKAINNLIIFLEEA